MGSNQRHSWLSMDIRLDTLPWLTGFVAYCRMDGCSERLYVDISGKMTSSKIPPVFLLLYAKALSKFEMDVDMSHN